MILNAKGGGRVPWYGKALALGAAVALVPAWGLAQQEQAKPDPPPDVAREEYAKTKKFAPRAEATKTAESGVLPGKGEPKPKVEVPADLQDRVDEADDAYELARIELDGRLAEMESIAERLTKLNRAYERAQGQRDNNQIPSEVVEKTEAAVQEAKLAERSLRNELRRAELAVRSAQRRRDRAQEEIRRFTERNSAPKVAAGDPNLVGGMGMGGGRGGLGSGMMSGMSGEMGGMMGRGMGGGEGMMMGGMPGMMSGGGGHGGGMMAGMAPARDPQADAIQAVLNRKVTVQFSEQTPLREVLQFLKEISKDPKSKDSIGFSYYLDPKAGQTGNSDIGENPGDAPVQMEVENVPLKTVLALLLRQVGLTYTTRDGLIVISSPETIFSLEQDERLKPAAQLGYGGMGGMMMGGPPASKAVTKKAAEPSVKKAADPARR